MRLPRVLWCIALLAVLPSYVVSNSGTCEVLGCQIGEQIDDSIAAYISGGIGRFPGAGSGDCVCDPPACNETSPCAGSADYFIDAGSNHVCVAGVHAGNRTNISLDVHGCGDDDYAAITITGGSDCTGIIAYGLIGYFCYDCAGLSCP